MSVVTRFAPSPTGFLHIGGARTALFNWLYARHMGGKYLLRIEDTDRKRSTPEAIDAILDGLHWLGLSPDEEPVFQFSCRDRHAEVVQQLIDQGLAYRCYCTPEELEAMREKAKAEKRSMRYDGTWRDRDPVDAPADITPVIRFKALEDGETVINDAVQGAVTIANSEMDDLIMLRADGTPTYYDHINFEAENLWRSTRTFQEYPTRWRLEVPEAGLDLSARATFDDQEFVTLISKPAFWEGRIEIEGTCDGKPIEGVDATSVCVSVLWCFRASSGIRFP